MAQYTYFLGTLFYLFAWTLIYYKRKDLRKELVIMGAIIMFLGVYTSYFYWTYDWWRPETLTNTRIGIEDFIFGFSMGGIISTVYKFFFKKKSVSRPSKEQNKNSKKQLLYAVGASFVLGHLLWFVFHLHSTAISTIASLIPLAVVYSVRSDFIKPSLYAASIMTLGSFPVYLAMHFLDPGLFANWWLNDQLTGLTILKVPIEDIVWFFMQGLLISPLYDFWHDKKPVNR